MLSTPSRWYVNLGITIIILIIVVVARFGNAALINKLKGGGAQDRVDHNVPSYHHNHLFSPQAQGLETDKESDANFNDFMSSVYGDKNVPAK